MSPAFKFLPVNLNPQIGTLCKMYINTECSHLQIANCHQYTLITPAIYIRQICFHKDPCVIT